MNKYGKVIWITGLSGSGKSTLGKEVVARLRSIDNTVLMLDGDEMREMFGANTVNNSNHERDERMALAMQYAKLCKLIARQGVTVVCSTISMFKEVHSWNRENQPNYFEVYLKVPFSELRNRDPKGIYRRFDSGELSNVAGLDLQVDEPKSPDILFEFEPNRKLSDMVEETLIKLSKEERNL